MNFEKYIVSLNLGGWAWTITKESWKDRLKRACECIKKEAPDAWIIGLSEVIPGKEEKYIGLIRKEFPDYVVVLPEAYKNNYKSAINVLLINQEGYHNHNTLTLNNLPNSLLYNYLSINTAYGYYTVLNAHIPHTCNDNKPGWYQQKRKEMRADFEQSISEACMLCKMEPDIQFIFMADANASPENAFIQKLSGTVNPLLFNATRIGDRDIATWRNPEYKNKHIDYIFYGISSVISPVIDVYYNEIVDTPIADKISDHAMIRGRVRTNIID